MTNLFSSIPTELPLELVEVLLKSNTVSIEWIVSRGHCSPPDSWYDQDQNEWVLLIQGTARLQFETEVVEMKPGDFINIPAHRRHRVDRVHPP